MSEKPAYQSFSVRTERAGMVMSVPFAARAIQHVDDFGNVWHGHGSEFRIFRSTLAGDTTLEITVAATPVPVAPEELQEWEAGEGVKRFRELGGDLDMGRIPKTKPYFDEFYVDPEGYVWISTPSPAGETVFAVLDPDGRYLGRLQLPTIQREYGIRAGRSKRQPVPGRPRRPGRAARKRTVIAFLRSGRSSHTRAFRTMRACLLSPFAGALA